MQSSSRYSFRRWGSGVSKTYNLYEENVTKRTQKTEILRNFTTDRCLTVRQILI
jgi:hypothetical protein